MKSMKLLKILVIAALASLIVASVAMAGTQTQKRDHVRTPNPTCSPTGSPTCPNQTTGIQLKIQKRDQTCDNKDRVKLQKRDQTCDNQDRLQTQSQSGTRQQLRTQAC